MDVKPLSLIISYVSAASTLNIYSPATGEMWQRAAEKINQSITKAEVKPQ